MTIPQNRQQAYEALCTHTHTPSLIKHALSVEAAMRAMACHFGEDEETWGIAGLLHDLDYEQFPQEHCRHTPQMLRELGYGEDFIRAILSHGYGLCTDVEPQTNLEKSLYAVDELTGLITACVLVRPSKSILDLTLKSVRKKWKDKAFAAGCNRSVILDGAERLGMDWDTLCTLVMEGMKAAAKELDLVGNQEGVAQ